MTAQRTGLFPWPIALALFVGAAITREPVVLIAAAAALAGWAVSFFTSRAALRRPARATAALCFATSIR